MKQSNGIIILIALLAAIVLGYGFYKNKKPANNNVQSALSRLPNTSSYGATAKPKGCGCGAGRS